MNIVSAFALLAVWLFCSGTRSEPGVPRDGVPRRRRAGADAHQAHAHQLQAPPAAHHARLFPDEPQPRRKGSQAAEPEDRPAQESATGNNNLSVLIYYWTVKKAWDINIARRTTAFTRLILELRSRNAIGLYLKYRPKILDLFMFELSSMFTFSVGFSHQFS